MVGTMTQRGRRLNAEQAAVSRTSPTKPARPLMQRQCACGGSSGMIGECEACTSKKLLGKPVQPTFAINEPGDTYEQEAERLAEQVMAMQEREVNRTGVIGHPSVQRQSMDGGPVRRRAAERLCGAEFAGAATRLRSKNLFRAALRSRF